MIAGGTQEDPWSIHTLRAAAEAARFAAEEAAAVGEGGGGGGGGGDEQPPPPPPHTREMRKHQVAWLLTGLVGGLISR